VAQVRALPRFSCVFEGLTQNRVLMPWPQVQAMAAAHTAGCLRLGWEPAAAPGQPARVAPGVFFLTRVAAGGGRYYEREPPAARLLAEAGGPELLPPARPNRASTSPATAPLAPPPDAAAGLRRARLDAAATRGGPFDGAAWSARAGPALADFAASQVQAHAGLVGGRPARILDRAAALSSSLASIDAAGANGAFVTILSTDASSREALVRTRAGEERAVINAGSMDYLGLSQHPAVVAAACAALTEHGSCLTNSRALCGSGTVHRELEAELAGYFEKEAALLLPAGGFRV
jgi:hypothetical protein